jgi:hypothetical protein
VVLEWFYLYKVVFEEAKSFLVCMGITHKEYTRFRRKYQENFAMCGEYAG